MTGVSRIVDTLRSGKKRRNRSRFAQAGRNQSSLRDASDGAAENITFQRESAKSLTSGTSVPKQRSQRTRAAFFFLLLLSVRAEEVPVDEYVRVAQAVGALTPTRSPGERE